MEYISSDTNIWLDFAAIDWLALPFRLPYIYLMDIDAVEDELLNPPGIASELVEIIDSEEFQYCIKELLKQNGRKVRLPEMELRKRLKK